MRRLLVVIAVAGILTAAMTVTASQPLVPCASKRRIPDPAGACPDAAFRCGTAEIDGFGSAEWRFYLTFFAPDSESCGSYTALVTFTLPDDSVLSLDETGTVCGPGKSFFATPGFSWGNPEEANGAWEFLSGTGQFSDVTGGTGINQFSRCRRCIARCLHRTSRKLTDLGRDPPSELHRREEEGTELCAGCGPMRGPGGGTPSAGVRILDRPRRRSSLVAVTSEARK